MDIVSCIGINPRSACAARVTIVVPCVCLSVCYSYSGSACDIRSVLLNVPEDLAIDLAKKIKKAIFIKTLHSEVMA